MATATWWSSFLDQHGRDSEEEAAFNGFLTTNGIPASAGPDQLQQAYVEFRVFMQESEDREADRGPDRAALATQQAVAEVEQQFVAKSRVSAPGVEKPLVAATRPKETRQEMGESGVGPGGESIMAPAQGDEPPQHPAVHDSAEGARVPETPTASPTQDRPGQATPEHEARSGRTGRRGEGD